MESEQKQVQRSCCRVVGLDIHPYTFSATIMTKADQKPILQSKALPMEKLEFWMKKHHQTGDVYVMEAGSNSFNTADRIRKNGGNTCILESCRVGQIKNSYLKNDSNDAKKAALVYLSGLARVVWEPDETTRTRRELLYAYLSAVKDATRHRNRIWAWLCSQGVKKKANIQLTKPSGAKWLLSAKDWTPQQRLILEDYIAKLVLAENSRTMFKKQMAIEVAEDPQLPL